MKRQIVAILLASGLLVGGTILVKAEDLRGATETAYSRDQTPVTPGGPPGFVTGIAAKYAVKMGDAHPRAGYVVLTSRQAAQNANGGGTVDSDEPVYFVVLHGRFTDTKARVPAHAPSPRGSVATLTIDPATQMVDDFSIGDYAPNMDLLGPVHPLPLRRLHRWLSESKG